MRSATELQRDVLDELGWTLGASAAEIGVSAHDGIVTLTGHVDSYAKKSSAEKAAKRVVGVRALVNDVIVKLSSSLRRDDADLAEAALHALSWHTSVPKDAVTVTVRNGWITLEGDVDRYVQKDAATRAVHDLSGVRGVTNLIRIKLRATAAQVGEKIEAAFVRSAAIDAQQVAIEVIGGRAILRGRVGSWTEHEEAERAAWAAPGITDVENELKVEEESLVPF